MKAQATLATTRLPSASCPNCRRKLDAVTGAAFADAGERRPPPPRPEPGDVTMCAYCGTILAFDAELIPRAVSREEKLRILAENPDAREMWKLWFDERIKR